MTRSPNTPTNTPASQQANELPITGPSKFPWTPLLVGLLLFLLTLPVIGVAFYASGSVRGEEFCPDDFTRRKFSYNKLPVLGWTLQGIEYDNLTGELEETLISSGLVTPPGESKDVAESRKRWHLYRDSSVPNSHDCDARFLVDYLTFYSEDEKTGRTSFWIQWNQQFPKSAKVFWPIVADLARHEMYLGIPEVMRTAIAVSEDRPDRLQSSLLAISKKLWQEFGVNDFEQEKYERAAVRLLRAQAIESSGESSAESESLFSQLESHVGSLDQLKQESEKLAADLLTEIKTKLAAKPTPKPAATNDSNQGSPLIGESVEEEITAEKPQP